MLNFHIVMAFYREYLHETIKQDIKNMDVYWHPVCEPHEIKYFEKDTEPFIQPIVSEIKNHYMVGYEKLNKFIELATIIDDHYYGFLGDDDMYAPGFISKIMKFINAKIIIFSASRGDNSPAPTDAAYQWPAIPLYLHKLNDIHVANIDLCQMIVRGDILKQTRFQEASSCDDGQYAENLRKKWPDDILILPEIGVFKSFYEKGRYNTDINTHRIR